MRISGRINNRVGSLGLFDREEARKGRGVLKNGQAVYQKVGA